MGVKVKPEPPSEETWRTHADPHRLVGWSRRVANARKYLLLACAVARHGLRAGETDAGRRVLEYLEGLGRGPKAGLAGRLVEDHLMPRFRGLFQAVYPNLTATGQKALGVPDGGGWAAVLVRHAPHPAQATKSVANVMIEQALLDLRTRVGLEVSAEVGAVEREVAARPRPKGAGRFGPLLGWVRGEPRPSPEAVAAGVLARVPADRRPAVPAGLPRTSLGWWSQLALHAHRVGQSRDRVCGLVREVFGDPFRPWVVPPGWAAVQAESALGVARHIDATGEYGVMPVLADALEDAGCDHPAVLTHCRTGGPHAAGCWVVSAVLGR